MKGLVKKYRASNNSVDAKIRDQLIMDYAPLIRYVAQRISIRLPSNIEIDDLISSGVIGLMDAIEKYDPSRDNKFKTYAEFRVRGAILDELRSQDWVPRSVRDKAKRIDKAHLELEQKMGRPVSDQELAEALNMPIEEYHDLIAKVKSLTLLSVDELSSNQQHIDKKSLMESVDGDSANTPFAHLKSKGVRDIIVNFIEGLPEKQKLVLSLYYYEDLNLKEIGKILDVTESRVSQLHTQAVERLRLKLKSAVTE